MIWAYVVVVIGAAVWFVPEPVQVPLLLAVPVCGFLYVRAMRRKVDNR